MESDARLLRWTAALAALSVGWLVAQWPHPIVHPAIGWIPARSRPSSPPSCATAPAAPPRTRGPAGSGATSRSALGLLFVAVLSSAHDSLAGPGAPSQRSGTVTMMLYVAAVLMLLWALLRLPMRRRSSYDVLQACLQGAAWAAELGAAAPWKISVNASARQLLEPSFVDTVAGILEDSGLDPFRLTIEITETAVFGGGRALDTVRALHQLGVKIALDDFGTGHSSLGLLRTRPVDVLKVDKSFVDGVTGTVEQEAIATSISEIAQALRLEAVAEGVETAAQAERLLELGYRLAQGFYFAHPLPPESIPPLCTVDVSAPV